MSKQPLILASTSPFRKAILEKINIHFKTISPHTDETILDGEQPADLVTRLSLEKAQAVVKDYPNALIIGSDQVACIEQQILGKPHNHQNAVKQLQLSRGKTVTFFTGLSLLNSQTNKAQSLCETFQVQFRQLTDHEIERYLRAETPYKCAGSFKSEALGISLFERFIGDDPNTLMGLPLIKLCAMLRNEGIDVP